MSDYQPRLRPMKPASHDAWLAVSRVPRTGKQSSDMTPDEQIDGQIETLLEWITRPGADQSQRRYDLETLAHIVLANPGAGWGKAPIDGDVHDHDCGICRGVTEDPIFDGHTYTYAPEEGA